MSKIEVLVFDGCPNVESALARVDAAVVASKAAVKIDVVRVDSDEDAARLHFLGSPTVRVDGMDVDQAALGRTDFGLQCRVYSFDGRLEAVPPVEWITAALSRSASRSGTNPESAGALSSSEGAAPKRG